MVSSENENSILTTSQIESNIDTIPTYVNLFGGSFSRPNLPLREHGGSYPAFEYIYHDIKQKDLPGWINKSQTLSLTSDAIGLPSTKSIFYKSSNSTASRHARNLNNNDQKTIIFHNKESKKNGTKILLNVAAEKVILRHFKHLKLFF